MFYRDNPFFNPTLSKEIVTKLASNIYSYKEKNRIITMEEEQDSQNEPYEFYDENVQTGDFNNGEQIDDQVYISPKGQTYQGRNMKGANIFHLQQFEGIESDKTHPPGYEGIDELIKKYEAKSPQDEELKDGFDTRLEGVSFGFRNEKIKENLRKDFKKLRRAKNTKSEGVLLVLVEVIIM